MDIEILRSDGRYRIMNMTDKEAVDILRGFLKHGQLMTGRGNGKLDRDTKTDSSNLKRNRSIGGAK